MPVIINQDGLAEDLPEEQAQAALKAGTHFVPLVGPDGADASAPLASVNDFLSQGYTQPSTDSLANYLKTAKFSTTEQQVKTVAENVAKAATLGLSTGVQVATGLSTPEDIAGRKEVNPGLATAGEVGGLVGSLALPGSGAVGVLAKIGDAAAIRIGAKAAEKGLVHTLGSRALKEGVENAVYAAGNELSKSFISNDPVSTMSVITNIGLSGALGGAFGAAFQGGEKLTSALWSATKGKELAKVIEDVRDRAQGVAGTSSLDEAAKAAGIDLTPAMRGTLTPEGSGIAASLRERSTRAAGQLDADLKNFYTATSDEALAALNKTKQDVARVADLSDFDQGVKVQSDLVDELSARYAPVKAQYDEIKQAVAGREMTLDALSSLTNDLGKVAVDAGALVRPGSDEAKLLNSIIGDVKNIKTLADLETFQSSVNADLTSKMMFGLKGRVMTALRNNEEKAITQSLGVHAPNLLEKYAAARLGYRELMDASDKLADRLRPGKYSGPESLISNIREMAPEKVLRNLQAAKDVDLQNHLDLNFPSASASIKDYQVNQLLKKAAQSARAVDDGIHLKTLFKQIDALSPELRSRILSEGQLNKLNGLRELIDRVPERLNPSGTGKAIDSMLSTADGGIALAAAVLTGNPLAGLAGLFARTVGREVPDAAKLTFLKMLGTTGPVDAVGVKAMFNLIDQMGKAQRLTQKVVKAALRPAMSIDIAPASASQLKKLDKMMTEAAESPDAATERISSVSSYLPDQAAMVGSMTASAVAYLRTLKPAPQGDAPLDAPSVNPVQQAKYERAMQIAEQPLLVIKSVKDGSLTLDDINHISSMYPQLYKSYQEQLLNEVIEAKADGREVPYKNIVSLSMFLQMPLESSTLPYNVSVNQSLSNPTPESAASPKPSSRKLEGIGEGAATPSQARRAERNK